MENVLKSSSKYMYSSCFFKIRETSIKLMHKWQHLVFKSVFVLRIMCSQKLQEKQKFTPCCSI